MSLTNENVAKVFAVGDIYGSDRIKKAVLLSIRNRIVHSKS